MRRLIALSVLVLLFTGACSVTASPAPTPAASGVSLGMSVGTRFVTTVQAVQFLGDVREGKVTTGQTVSFLVKPGADVTLTKGDNCLWYWAISGSSVWNGAGGSFCLTDPQTVVKEILDRQAGKVPSLFRIDLQGFRNPFPEHRYLTVLDGEWFENKLTIPEIRELVRAYQRGDRKGPIFFPSVKLGQPAFRTMPWRLTYVSGCRWHWENFTPEDELRMQLIAEGDTEVCDLAGSDLLEFWLQWN